MMFFYIVSLMYVDAPTKQWHKFIVMGHDKYCMVDYQNKAISCAYSTMKKCREQLQGGKASVCYPNKFTQ
jgi:hypothetical protein